jgi:hypothetical protein
MGNDRLPNCPEVAGIAKHLADLNRQVSEELRQHRRIVQQPVLHGGGGRKTQVVARPLQTPLQRSHGVTAKVKVVLLEQRLQQQPNLYFLGPVHRVVRSAVRHPDADERQQLLDVEGLRHVIVGAG